MTLEVIRDLADASAVAKKAALDLAQELEGLLEAREGVNLVLTGGTVGIKTLEELAPLIKNFDLSRLFIWWGDERFVSAESPERNFVQARAALLSKIKVADTWQAAAWLLERQDALEFAVDSAIRGQLNELAQEAGFTNADLLDAVRIINDAKDSGIDIAVLIAKAKAEASPETNPGEDQSPFGAP
jgi:6-phosphogluconolactonase/glucosamine-6-phosphate isomerase/deaminase